MTKFINYFSIFFLLMVFGCSSSDETITAAIEEYNENYLEEKMPANISLDELRTQLSDVYTSRKNEIPEGFARLKVEEEVEQNLYEGYRVQIYSGRSVDVADTIDARFKAWSDTTISGYQAETYVSFRTPFYKVHVGDFHNRDMAIDFSNLVKRKFEDAWVVYDRVDPNKVPSDTVSFSVK